MTNKYQRVIEFIRHLYQTTEKIPLHEPRFYGNEKLYLQDCIDSTFVSSVGKYVDRFERMIQEFTGIGYAVATVNGTAALHTALQLVGVNFNDEVITQPLSFIATCNAISYCGAKPVFVDVERDTMGMSPQSLKSFLLLNASREPFGCINKKSGRRISAVLPMHTFGHPCRIEEIAAICSEFGIPLVEDAAEGLGTYHKGLHVGSFGKVSVFSFNGNKTITSGGGGMIVTNDLDIARRAKFITTTAKRDHAYEFIHDEVGYNYRLPNINAALGCAQMENLQEMLTSKRSIANRYKEFFSELEIEYVSEPKDSVSNYWLNALILESRESRDNFLTELNAAGVMCRPAWQLMTESQMYSSCQAADIENAKRLEKCLVNIPSSAIIL